MGVLSTIQLRVWGFCHRGFCQWGFCPRGFLSVPRFSDPEEVVCANIIGHEEMLLTM